MVLTEIEPAALRHLRAQVVSFDADDRLRLVASDAFRFLAACGQQFDIVFVDPPFGRGLASRACQCLDDYRVLRPGALVYIETGIDEPAMVLPSGWTWHRRTTAGQVCPGLATPPATRSEDNGPRLQQGNPNGHQGNLPGDV